METRERLEAGYPGGGGSGGKDKKKKGGWKAEARVHFDKQCGDERAGTGDGAANAGTPAGQDTEK